MERKRQRKGKPRFLENTHYMKRGRGKVIIWQPTENFSCFDSGKRTRIQLALSSPLPHPHHICDLPCPCRLHALMLIDFIPLFTFLHFSLIGRRHFIICVHGNVGVLRLAQQHLLLHTPCRHRGTALIPGAMHCIADGEAGSGLVCKPGFQSRL